jgi:hypothetical protein
MQLLNPHPKLAIDERQISPFAMAVSSGWNGVFLAEVARLAPCRIPEVTGAVLMVSYAGLVLGPV